MPAQLLPLVSSLIAWRRKALRPAQASAKPLLILMPPAPASSPHRTQVALRACESGLR